MLDCCLLCSQAEGIIGRYADKQKLKIVPLTEPWGLCCHCCLMKSPVHAPPSISNPHQTLLLSEAIEWCFRAGRKHFCYMGFYFLTYVWFYAHSSQIQITQMHEKEKWASNSKRRSDHHNQLQSQDTATQRMGKNDTCKVKLSQPVMGKLKIKVLFWYFH